jgi:diacylglycerol kinase (ATP)
MIAIANSSQYGNNARVAPLASVMDQSLQLAVVKKVPAQRGFPFAYQMFTGKLETGKDYECLAFQKGTIQVSKPTAFHIDGEPCGYANEFKIEILPQVPADDCSCRKPGENLIKYHHWGETAFLPNSVYLLSLKN